MSNIQIHVCAIGPAEAKVLDQHGLAMGMGCACHAPEVYCILEPRTTSEKG